MEHALKDGIRAIHGT